MRTLRIAILSIGLASLALTGCSKKKDPAAPEPVTTEPATDTANPCGGEPNPCGGEADPCGGAADPCGGGE